MTVHELILALQDISKQDMIVKVYDNEFDINCNIREISVTLKTTKTEDPFVQIKTE